MMNSFNLKDKKRVILLFALICAAALALRLARCFIEQRLDKDAVLYLQMAKAVAAGNINGAFMYNPRIPPLYIFLMAAGEYLGIGAENAGIIISLISGTLLLFPVFFITRKLADEGVALAAVFLVATHPYLVRTSVEVMRDSLFLLFAFTAVAFAVCASGHQFSRKWYLTGFFGGLALMTRNEGMEVIITVPVWIASEICLARMKHIPFMPVVRKCFSAALCVTAGFLIATVPMERMLLDTPSRWSVADYRISGFIRGFFNLSEKEVLKQEQH